MSITIDGAQVQALAARVREMPDATLAKFYLEDRFGVEVTVAVDVPPGGGRKVLNRKAAPMKRERNSDAVLADLRSRVVQAVAARPGQRIGEIAKVTGIKRVDVARAIKAERGGRIRQDGERGQARYYPIEAE